MRRAAIWAIASLVAAGLLLAGALGSFDGPSTFVVPASAQLVQASASLPSVPTDAPIGVPVTELDPGFSGSNAQILGRLAECNHDAGGPQPTVALVRGDHYVAGETANRHGEFAFAVPWLGSVAVGTVEAYTLVLSLGETRQVLIEPLHITYAMLHVPCAHATTP